MSTEMVWNAPIIAPQGRVETDYSYRLGRIEELLVAIEFEYLDLGSDNDMRN